MDENLSWRAKLAKANINILSLSLVRTSKGIVKRWFVEFTYHPKPGVFKWCKTYIDIQPVFDTYAALNEDNLVEVDVSAEDMAKTILDTVLDLRKELED